MLIFTRCCRPVDEEDFEWEPPTEAEMKVIQARRERQDKISKLMGDYLLKGYKMLGDCCEVCGVSRTSACNNLVRIKAEALHIHSYWEWAQAHWSGSTVTACMVLFHFTVTAVQICWITKILVADTFKSCVMRGDWIWSVSSDISPALTSSANISLSLICQVGQHGPAFSPHAY